MKSIALSFQVEHNLSKDAFEALLLEACESVSRTLVGYTGADGSQVRSISPIESQIAGK